MINNQYRFRYTVGAAPQRGHHFSTLGAALTALNAASANLGLTTNQRALIVVQDPVIETASIAWMNFVDVYFLPGASITFNNLNGITMAANMDARLAAATPLMPAIFVNNGANFTGLNLTQPGSNTQVRGLGIQVRNNTLVAPSTAITVNGVNASGCTIEDCWIDADYQSAAANSNGISVTLNGGGELQIKGGVVRASHRAINIDGTTGTARVFNVYADGQGFAGRANAICFMPTAAGGILIAEGSKLSGANTAAPVAGDEGSTLRLGTGQVFVYDSIVEQTGSCHAVAQRLALSNVEIYNSTIQAQGGGNAFAVLAGGGVAPAGARVHNNTIEGSIGTWTFAAQVLNGSNVVV